MKIQHRIYAAIFAVSTAATAFVNLPLSALAAEDLIQQTYVYDGYTVEYRELQAWSSSKRVSVTLTNTGSEAIENWMLYFDPNGECYGFSGAYPAETDDGIQYFENGGYNAVIAANASVSFTYLVDGAETAPEEFSFCQSLQPLADGYTVSMQVYGQWGERFNGEFLIENNSSKPIYGWELTVDSSFDIESSWAADVTDLGNGKYLLKGNYNTTVPANSSVNVGFIGDGDEFPVLNGASLSSITADPKKLNYLTGGYSVADIEEMNAGAVYPVEIEQYNNGIVTSVDGKFTDVLVLDEESAMDAVYSVRRILGITNPRTTLTLNQINEGKNDSDYTSYFFDQVYDGIPVYGRSLTVVAQDSGQTLSLDSCYYFQKDSFDTTPAVSVETVTAENPGFDVKLVIYTLDDYVYDPVLAYVLTNGEVKRVISAEDRSLIDEIELYDTATAKVPEVPVDVRTADGRLCQAIAETPAGVTSPEAARAIIAARSSELNVNFETPGSNNLLAPAFLRDDPQVTTYHFDQYFKGVRVFAREIAVSVRKANLVRYWLSTNTVQIPDSFSVMTSMAKPVPSAELVIYTWDAQENDAAPQLAYIWDDPVNQLTMIQLENGTVMTKQLGKGLDEGSYVNTGTPEAPNYTTARPMKLCYFPVTLVTDAAAGLAYYKLSVKKTDLNIPNGGSMVVEMRQMNGKDITAQTVNSPGSYFYYPEAVSAYTNSINVTKWYALDSGLNRPYYVESYNEQKYPGLEIDSSLNLKDGDLLVGVNDSRVDNAISNPIMITTTTKNKKAYTYGASLDVLAHEFTHGVFRDAINWDISSDATARGINEGYADLFGHFVTKTWYNGAASSGQASITNPRNMANDLPSKANFSSNELYRALGYTVRYLNIDCHSLIPFVNKPAYLLNTKYKIPMTALVDIYYHSLFQVRYSDNSCLNSVRAAVLKAAKARGYDQSVVLAISAAYEDTLKMNEDVSMMELHLREAGSNKALEMTDDMEIRIVNEQTKEEAEMITPASAKLNAGWYWITVISDDYQTYCYKAYMGYDDTNIYISLVKKGSTQSPVTIRIKDSVDKKAYDGTVELRRLQDDGTEVPYDSYQTNGTKPGVLENLSLPAGYYLVYVTGATDYANKQVLSVPGNNTPVEFDFADYGVNPNYDISLFSLIYTETNDFNDFRLGRPTVSHNTDTSGQRSVAFSTWQSGLYAMTTNYFFYNSACTPYQLQFTFSIEQMLKLQEIVASNSAEGKNQYTMDISCINAQNPTMSTVSLLSAEDIVNNAVLVNNRYILRIAILTFDTSSMTFNVSYPFS